MEFSKELTAFGVSHEFVPVPGSPRNHDQLLQFEAFDTMAFYDALASEVSGASGGTLNGRFDPSLPLAFRIAEAFNLRVEEVFDKTDV